MVLLNLSSTITWMHLTSKACLIKKNLWSFKTQTNFLKTFYGLEFFKTTETKHLTSPSSDKWEPTDFWDVLWQISGCQDYHTLHMVWSIVKLKESTVHTDQQWVYKVLWSFILFTNSVLKNKSKNIFLACAPVSLLDVSDLLSQITVQIQDQWKLELNLMEMNM